MRSAWAAVAPLALVVACTVGGGSAAQRPPAAVEPAAAARPAITGTAVGTDAADPVRVRIPDIGVDAPIGPLAVIDGVLAAPDTNEAVGWWRAGPEPGEPGPAVLAGHVDSHLGPAVFFRLRELRPGAEILVDRADGSTAGFRAQRVERHPKAAFPTDAVYADTPQPTLRVVTCGGSFDRQARSYRDNVIVFADPA